MAVDQALDPTGALDEAYERLHTTGPEFAGWLSNHGPMAVEAMVRGDHADVVHGWVDRYSERLDDLPAATGPIGDRIEHFTRTLTNSHGRGCWPPGGRGCCRASWPAPRPPP